MTADAADELARLGALDHQLVALMHLVNALRARREAVAHQQRYVTWWNRQAQKAQEDL